MGTDTRAITRCALHDIDQRVAGYLLRIDDSHPVGSIGGRSGEAINHGGYQRSSVVPHVGLAFSTRGMRSRKVEREQR